MHPNPAFRKPDTARNIAFARARGFGTLALNAEGGPLISHIPFVLAEDGGFVELHLVRSNPILRLLDAPQPAVIAIPGPDSYISPDWYGIDDQVPTWNYVAVHLRGPLERLPQGELRGLLDRLAAHFEPRLAPKPPWIADKMTPEALEKLMRQIVPCRMQVEAINGTWKLNQNKDDDVRLRAADAVTARGIGSELDALGALMRTPPEQT
ncbi:FMN-binding negative transcriptional regulator [Candidatus Rhodobacter oscarellae]|uniref:FMN-binding negative transcriptional regulator n=1 Tax=Candidatus Rhodobacter oscarellae TaxID=1675527 RepID=UPI0006717F05|nr:FMN-binding negative transcriptional regulator [Candidatus Rhodobacter lobularis]